MIYCKNCGYKVKDDVRFCGECGFEVEKPIESQPSVSQQAISVDLSSPEPAYQKVIPQTSNGESLQNTNTVLIFCLLLGWVGAHRLYVGKYGTGAIWFLTYGLFGIGVLVDLWLISFGKFKDRDGLPYKKSTWGKVVAIILTSLFALAVGLVIAILVYYNII